MTIFPATQALAMSSKLWGVGVLGVMAIAKGCQNGLAYSLGWRRCGQVYYERMLTRVLNKIVDRLGMALEHELGQSQSEWQ
jgi:hypothetical protein